jgi:hypothetical protein
MVSGVSFLAFFMVRLLKRLLVGVVNKLGFEMFASSFQSLKSNELIAL